MNKYILVIDRSRTIQILLSTYFRNAGHQVINIAHHEKHYAFSASIRTFLISSAASAAKLINEPGHLWATDDCWGARI